MPNLPPSDDNPIIARSLLHSHLLSSSLPLPVHTPLTFGLPFLLIPLPHPLVISDHESLILSPSHVVPDAVQQSPVVDSAYRQCGEAPKVV